MVTTEYKWQWFQSSGTSNEENISVVTQMNDKTNELVQDGWYPQDFKLYNIPNRTWVLVLFVRDIEEWAAKQLADQEGS